MNVKIQIPSFALTFDAATSSDKSINACHEKCRARTWNRAKFMCDVCLTLMVVSWFVIFSLSAGQFNRSFLNPENLSLYFIYCVAINLLLIFHTFYFFLVFCLSDPATVSSSWNEMFSSHHSRLDLAVSSDIDNHVWCSDTGHGWQFCPTLLLTLRRRRRHCRRLNATMMNARIGQQMASTDEWTANGWW